MDICANEKEMSLLFYLWYMRQANGPRKLWGVTGGAEEAKFIGGSQQLTEKISEQLGDSVKLNHPVTVITHSSDDVTVKTLNDKEFKAKYLILAIPPITQMKIHFNPSLSPRRSCLIQRSPMGMVMKCIVFYGEPFWEKLGFNGYVACTDKVEVIGLVTEDVKPGGKTKMYGLICFVYLNNMINLTEMSEKERKGAVCKSLAKFYGSDKALEPIHFINKAWSDESYVCGGYTCYYPPGALTLFGPAMRAPIGPRVFLAGTETATHWVGYMNGAVDAGQRAAREVLCAEGKIALSEIWVQESGEKYQPTWSERLMPSIDSVVNLTYAALGFGTVLAIVQHIKHRF